MFDKTVSSILEKWSPVTSDFGLIQSPLEKVVVEFLAWRGSLGIDFSRKDITTSLDDALQSLQPLAANKARQLFVSTHSQWVAYFQNGIQGSDPFPVMSYLAQRLGVLAMRICSVPKYAKYQGTIWEVYAPSHLGGIPPLGYRRSIAAMNDGGKWVFEEVGERYPFERVEKYELPLKKQRLNREMLKDYLKHFSVELYSDDFLNVSSSTPAVRLQQITKVWQAPEFTREQVIGGLPWKQ